MTLPDDRVRTQFDSKALDAMATAPSTIACQECGGPVMALRRGKRFCSMKCRMVFNKRREARGKQLYDLYMPFRYERAAARELDVQAQMNRLCMHWRTEDDLERGGRKSWGDWRTFLRDMPCLRVERLGSVRIKK